MLREETQPVRDFPAARHRAVVTEPGLEASQADVLIRRVQDIPQPAPCRPSRLAGQLDHLSRLGIDVEGGTATPVDLQEDLMRSWRDRQLQSLTAADLSHRLPVHHHGVAAQPVTPRTLARKHDQRPVVDLTHAAILSPCRPRTPASADGNTGKQDQLTVSGIGSSGRGFKSRRPDHFSNAFMISTAKVHRPAEHMAARSARERYWPGFGSRCPSRAGQPARRAGRISSQAPAAERRMPQGPKRKSCTRRP
jgi:hypothetical protein